MALSIVLIADRLLERLFLFLAPGLATFLQGITLHGGQHARGLLAPHHRDARIGPHPQQAWRIGATTHAVIAGTETAANDDGELGHLRAGNSGHHLCTVLGDSVRLVLAAHHEAGDVLQEYQRNATLTA